MVEKAEVHSRRLTLSERAMDLAESFGLYYTFEEDCRFAVFYYEHPEIWRAATQAPNQVRLPGLAVDADDEAIRAAMLAICKAWYPALYPEARWHSKGGKAA